MFSINKYKFLRLLPDNEYSDLQSPPALEPLSFPDLQTENSAHGSGLR